MIDVRQTIAFQQWLARLADRRAVEKIAQRIVRVQAGLFGDVKSIGGGVSEIRINHGLRLSRLFHQAWRGRDPIALRRRQVVAKA